jgi:hypothetical protein
MSKGGSMPDRRKLKADANAIPSVFTPKFWLKADSRSLVAKTVQKRRAALRDAIQADSPQQESIIDRISFLEIVLETMEVEAQESGQFDSNRYCALTNTLVGLLKSIGLERKAKPVGDLQSYLKERAAS